MDKFDSFVNMFCHKQMVESVLSIPRNSLDPTVWQSFENGRLPILQDVIKKQILTDINKINNIVPVVSFFMLGSILTNRYDEDSDIDVNVQIDPQVADNISSAELLHQIKKINGRLAVGTTHPINYFVIADEYDLDKTEAAYDISNETWIKHPESISPDVQNVIARMEATLQDIDISTGKLRRDLIDFDELRKMDKKDVKVLRRMIVNKLDDIEETVKNLVNVYNDVHTLRKMAFDRVLTPEEIRSYGHKNRLPENIIYKLLEKYYYVRLMHSLKNIIEDGEDGFSFDDIRDVKQASKEFWSR